MQKILNPIITSLDGVDATTTPSPGSEPVKLSVKLAFQSHIGGVSGSDDKMKTLALGLKLATLDDYVDDIVFEDAELELLSKLIKNLRNPIFTDIVYAQMEKVLDETKHIEAPS